jgi:hypothetical protein
MQVPSEPEQLTVDESVEAFAKLKKLCPLQNELQRKLEAEGLRGEEAEELEYLNDEIQSLLERLQQFGFNMPGCARLCAHRPQAQGAAGGCAQKRSQRVRALQRSHASRTPCVCQRCNTCMALCSA